MPGESRKLSMFLLRNTQQTRDAWDYNSTNYQKIYFRSSVANQQSKENDVSNKAVMNDRMN